MISRHPPEEPSTASQIVDGIKVASKKVARSRRHPSIKVSSIIGAERRTPKATRLAREPRHDP
jgi:hypothetical protein